MILNEKANKKSKLNGGVKMKKNKTSTEATRKLRQIDIDSILDDVRRVRASLFVMNNSLDALFGGDAAGNYEMRALLFQNEKIVEMNLENIDQIIDTLRKGGAKDYDIDEEEAAA